MLGQLDNYLLYIIDIILLLDGEFLINTIL